MKALHWIGGALVLLAVYDMVAPNVSAQLPTLEFPTSNNMTNLLIGGAIFVVPMLL